MALSCRYLGYSGQSFLTRLYIIYNIYIFNCKHISSLHTFAIITQALTITLTYFVLLS